MESMLIARWEDPKWHRHKEWLQLKHILVDKHLSIYIYVSIYSSFVCLFFCFVLGVFLLLADDSWIGSSTLCDTEQDQAAVDRR